MFIGIDPGVSGGIARVFSPPYGFDMALPMPDSDRELYVILRDWYRGAKDLNIPVSAFIERVRPGVFGGKFKMGVVSAFTFGGEARRITALLGGALNARYEFVEPAEWQRALGCRTKGDKNISKARAVELFPKISVTHAIADALLIAEYGHRLKTGRVLPPPRKVK